MKPVSLLTSGLLALLCTATGWATTQSYTGMFSSPEDTFLTTVDVSSGGTLSVQTFGFGGGTNAAGSVIPAGGFDPFVAVFAGAGPNAGILDGTSDLLTNYSTYQGCPAAGVGALGSCGDVFMSFSVTPGTYTVLLSDAGYIPNAVFDGGTLGEGFTDLTGGSFPLQTCAGQTCVTDSPSWALDITAPGAPAVPEPHFLGCAGILLLTPLLLGKFNSKNPRNKF